MRSTVTPPVGRKHSKSVRGKEGVVGFLVIRIRQRSIVIESCRRTSHAQNAHPHINYTTPIGSKATLRVDSVK